MEIDKRFVYSGHAIGAAAHFHRLDDLHDLDHVVPTQAASALSPVGGLSHNQASNFCFKVDQPRCRELLSVGHAETRASGKQVGNLHETEVLAIIQSAAVVEKLHVDLVEVHQKGIRGEDKKPSTAYTTDSRIEGLRLGNVVVNVELDDSPFAKNGTMEELNSFFGQQDEAWRRENAWRFHTQPNAKEIQAFHGKYFCTLVKKIEAVGSPEDLKNIHVDGYSIKWDGFGWIFLGEVIVCDKYRRVTMIRLKMGSDAGGHGSIGDVQSDSGLVP
jgi:hypothetical protein